MRESLGIGESTKHEEKIEIIPKSSLGLRANYDEGLYSVVHIIPKLGIPFSSFHLQKYF